MPYLGRSPGSGVRSRFIYAATSGQTSFSGNDSNSVSLAYEDTLYMDVYQNGVLLKPVTDYAATTGTSVVLTTGATTDDVVEMIVYDTFAVADTVSKTNGGTFAGAVTVPQLNVDNITIDGNTISSTDTNGDITLDPNGTGKTVIQGGDSNYFFAVKGGTYGLRYNSNASSSQMMIEAVDDTLTASHEPLFIGGSTVSLGIAGSEKVKVDASGQIGISGSTASFDTTGSVNGLQLYYETDSGLATVGSYSSGGSTQLTFHTNSGGGASSEAMCIDSSGSLLGPPSANFNIKTGSGTGDMTFSTNGTERVRLNADGNLLINSTSDGNAKIYATRGGSGTTAFFEITSSATSGNIAINTSMPQNSNNTNTSHLKSTTQNVGSFHLHGNGSSTFSSDERLKKNIETTRDGYLEDLVALRVVKYNWQVDDDSTSKELGLIAQEVQKIFPSLVIQNDDELLGMTDTLALKFSVLPIITIKAVQELKAELDAEKAKTTTLETQVADLISRVTALENAQ